MNVFSHDVRCNSVKRQVRRVDARTHRCDACLRVVADACILVLVNVTACIEQHALQCPTKPATKRELVGHCTAAPEQCILMTSHFRNPQFELACGLVFLLGQRAASKSTSRRRINNATSQCYASLPPRMPPSHYRPASPRSLPETWPQWAGSPCRSESRRLWPTMAQRKLAAVVAGAPSWSFRCAGWSRTCADKVPTPCRPFGPALAQLVARGKSCLRRCRSVSNDLKTNFGGL